MHEQQKKEVPNTRRIPSRKFNPLKRSKSFLSGISSKISTEKDGTNDPVWSIFSA
jgi:hypothetical protein